MTEDTCAQTGLRRARGAFYLATVNAEIGVISALASEKGFVATLQETPLLAQVWCLSNAVIFVVFGAVLMARRRGVVGVSEFRSR